MCLSSSARVEAAEKKVAPQSETYQHHNSTSEMASSGPRSPVNAAAQDVPLQVPEQFAEALRCAARHAAAGNNGVTSGLEGLVTFLVNLHEPLVPNRAAVALLHLLGCPAGLDPSSLGVALQGLEPWRVLLLRPLLLVLQQIVCHSPPQDFQKNLASITGTFAPLVLPTLAGGQLRQQGEALMTVLVCHALAMFKDSIVQALPQQQQQHEPPRRQKSRGAPTAAVPVAAAQVSSKQLAIRTRPAAAPQTPPKSPQPAVAAVPLSPPPMGPDARHTLMAMAVHPSMHSGQQQGTAHAAVEAAVEDEPWRHDTAFLRTAHQLIHTAVSSFFFEQDADECSDDSAPDQSSCYEGATAAAGAAQQQDEEHQQVQPEVSLKVVGDRSSGAAPLQSQLPAKPGWSQLLAFSLGADGASGQTGGDAFCIVKCVVRTSDSCSSTGGSGVACDVPESRATLHCKPQPAVPGVGSAPVAMRPAGQV